MDETLVQAAVDFGGRAYLVSNANLTGIPLVSVSGGKEASFQTDCFEDFWHGFVNAAQCNLHIDVIRGRSDHHKVEGSFKEFFENPQFRTDGLKIYPTLVIRGTGLYELWKQGKYRNYPPSFLVDLISKILSIVPPWVRVYRIQRDIPMPLVTSGVENGNLRDLSLKRMKDLNLVCRDVRTREVGIQEIHNKVKPENIELIRRDYYANEGWETFISYEDPKQDILIGLLRLRKCGASTFRPELKGECVCYRPIKYRNYRRLYVPHEDPWNEQENNIAKSISSIIKCMAFCTFNIREIS